MRGVHEQGRGKVGSACMSSASLVAYRIRQSTGELQTPVSHTRSLSRACRHIQTYTHTYAHNIHVHLLSREILLDLIVVLLYPFDQLADVEVVSGVETASSVVTGIVFSRYDRMPDAFIVHTCSTRKLFVTVEGGRRC